MDGSDQSERRKPDEAGQEALNDLLRQESSPPLRVAKAYYLKGWALIRQADTMENLRPEERSGKYAEAEKALMESMRLNPGDPKGWEALGWAQMKLGKSEEAISSASKALALDPKSAKPITSAPRR